MSNRTALSGMTREELLAERQRLDATFSGPKALLANLAIVAIAVAMGLYAMKDGISLILTAIIVALLVSVVRRFRYRRQIIAELTARG